MSQVTIDVEDVTQRNINEVLSEAAYSGVLAACVIKEQKVDIQTFESTPDGGIKFDEYADVEPEEGAEIVLKAKVKKYGDRLPAYVPQDTSYHDNSRSHPAGPAYNSGPRRGGERNRDLEEVIDMVVDVVDMVRLITITVMDVAEVLIIILGINNPMGPCRHLRNNNLMAQYHRHHHNLHHHDHHNLMVNRITGINNLLMVHLCNNQL